MGLKNEMFFRQDWRKQDVIEKRTPDPLYMTVKKRK